MGAEAKVCIEVDFQSIIHHSISATWIMNGNAPVICMAMCVLY